MSVPYKADVEARMRSRGFCALCSKQVSDVRLKNGQIDAGRVVDFGTHCALACSPCANGYTREKKDRKAAEAAKQGGLFG